MAEVEAELPEQSTCDTAASTPKASRLNGAAPDFVPTGKPPHVSIDRTVSGLDKVKFSPANGVCTPSSTTCWYWDGCGWHCSPHIGKGASPGGSWGSPHTVLAPLTPQQGGPHGWRQQQASTDAGSSSDGGLASDGSLSSCGSGGPAPPLLCHPQQHMHSPFYWAHHHHHYPGSPASPHGHAAVLPVAVQQWVSSEQGGPLPHSSQLLQVAYQHPAASVARQQVHLPGHMPAYMSPHPQLPYGMPPQSPSPRSMDPGFVHSPFMTPQRPPMHHGLPPLAMPATLQQYACGQTASPSYTWQPGTPSQWQEPGPQRRSWPRQRSAVGTPATTPRRPSRMGSTSLNSSLTDSLAGSQNTSPDAVLATPLPATPATAGASLQPTHAACERRPLQDLQLVLPAGAAHPPSLRSCSPVRKASGLTAADNAHITALLQNADLLKDDQVPKQVADLKTLLSSDSQEPINARQRRTLRRAMERATKALGLTQQGAGDSEDAGPNVSAGSSSGGSDCTASCDPSDSTHAAAGPSLTITVPGV